VTAWRDGMPHGIMRGGVAETITYLELDDPAGIRPAGPPRVSADVARVDPPDGEISRWFYSAVGGAYAWTDRLDDDEATWQAHAERVETWVATVGAERAGYFELLKEGENVEIAFFGLLQPYHGLGLGGHLLTVALRRGFELGSRVWLHTNTLDGPHALPNYLARGLVTYRTENA
jgi:GNAT superfamily N-acetyltransferase